MGSLNLPPSGTVYVDTQVVIYSVEKHPDYAALLAPLWQATSTGALQVVTSELTLMECLVVPIRRGDAVLQQAYEHILLRTSLGMVAIDQKILRDAAKLRASAPPLRTPDAIHFATAVSAGSALFVTNDTGLRNLPGVPVAVLKDFSTP